MRPIRSHGKRLTSFQRDEAVFSGCEYVHLIDPAQLNYPDLLLEMFRGVLTGVSAGNSSTFGKQRYVVKGTKTDLFGFRSLLEKRLAGCFGLDQQMWSVHAVSSGTNALRLALRSLLPYRDNNKAEVIIPAITVPATAEAVLMEGFRPLLVDVDSETWSLDPTCAEKALSERTAAIISVDWLGTPVDISALQCLSTKHNIAWISDSAQSFGAKYWGKMAVGYADATVFSTGYPKVFHTAGRGGVLVIRRDQAKNLWRDPTGLLRHEPLCEINAFFGLELLNQLESHIQHRREIAQIYHDYLGSLPGFVFQRIPQGILSNCYQMSLRIIKERAGISAKELSIALHNENIQASCERVKSLDEDERLAGHLLTPVPLTVSHSLSQDSLTLPTSNHLKREDCFRICRTIQSLCENQEARQQWPIPKDVDGDIPSTLPVRDPPLRSAQVLTERSTSLFDIAKETVTYRVSQHNINQAKHVLVPADELLEEFVSIEELLDSITRSESLCVGSKLVPPFVVKTILPEGDMIVAADKPGAFEIELAGSGSPSSVKLSLNNEGELLVAKSCNDEGIDGNGRPWLRRQISYLRTNKVRELSELFVHPTRVLDEGGETKLYTPYIHGYSLAHNILCGAGVDFTYSILREVCNQMARKVWIEDIQVAPGDYIQKAHLERMDRRVSIAARHYPPLEEVLRYREVVLNGQVLLNFPELRERLWSPDVFLRMNPSYISLLHGDLNVYNIICVIRNDNGVSIKLVDPRGTPLLTPELPIEKIERGDFIYDLAKIKFSLSGFALIRAGVHRFRRLGTNIFELSMPPCFALDTFQKCNSEFIDFVENGSFFSFLEEKFQRDIRSGLWKNRLLLAEAANFIADSACALGRNCSHEVLPLYLIGLAKLNRFLWQQHCS